MHLLPAHGTYIRIPIQPLTPLEALYGGIWLRLGY